MRGRRGQSLIESCLVMALIGLVFAGVFQVSQLFAARDVLSHAAARGARARTVGFNRWMVEKSVLAAAIPNAGRITEPPFVNENPALRADVATMRPGDLWSSLLGIAPVSAQAEIERARVPYYLGAQNRPRSRYILDYANWDTVQFSTATRGIAPGGGGSPVIEVTVRQDVPPWVPMHRAFYDADSVELTATASIENHYPLYLEDRNW